MSRSVRELLDQAKNFHRQLSDFYHGMSEQSKVERARMLLDYMAVHERELEACIEDYEAQAGNGILEHMFKFVPDDPNFGCFGGIEITPEMSLDDVIAVVLKLDNCLVRFYRQISEECQSEHVRELFTRLLKQAEKDERITVRNALELELQV